MTYALQLSYKRLRGAKATKLGSRLEWLYVLMRNDRESYDFVLFLTDP